MLQTIRIAEGYDTNPMTAQDDCNTCKMNKQAYMEQEEIVKIPTLKLTFLDEVNAKSSHVGQEFATETLEEVCINGKTFPCGSKVKGEIVEVIRPSGCEKGALKLAFKEIKHCDCCEKLPKQILTAQVNCSNQQNFLARAVSWPFTWVGGLVGTAGRTVGGAISNLGNAAEDISGGVGIAMGELLQTSGGKCSCTCKGKFGDRFTSAGRSLKDAAKSTIKAPVDVARTAVSGTVGLFQSTSDEIAYLVDPKGAKIAAVNPREKITIAFGCAGN